jgi:D-alanyl-lipoteichoic acid acyltransferase DltB (MBOAT superfamily)
MARTRIATQTRFDADGNMDGCVLSYAVQIYCDLRGYSDRHRNRPALLELQTHAEFRLSVPGANIAELWRKWHISTKKLDARLSLYIPLRGMFRVAAPRRRFTYRKPDANDCC